MKKVRIALEEVVAGGRFTVVEARKLMGFHWPYEWELESLPRAVASEAEVLHILIEAADEVVREGFYAADDDDPDMITRISHFLTLLPKEPISESSAAP